MIAPLLLSCRQLFFLSLFFALRNKPSQRNPCTRANLLQDEANFSKYAHAKQTHHIAWRCYRVKRSNQALGVGIASELDLAYWHARYTAASRFDAGSVSADTASSSSTSHVVPPPEVYFVCLAFHVPSVAELRALVGLDTTRALRSVLDQVFDFPVGDAGVLGIQSTGVRGMCVCWGGGVVEGVGLLNVT